MRPVEMSSSAGGAPAPACPSCGAPLPLDFMSHGIRCRHCGAALTMDEGLRAAMRRYVGDVAAAAKGELEARFKAAFYVQNERAAGSIVFGAVGLAIALTGAFVAWSIMRSVEIELPMPYFLILLVMWAGSLAAFARGWGIMYALPSPELLAAVRAVRCSTCGAAMTLSAGQTTGRCEHCGGAALVPSELAVGLLSESRGKAATSVNKEREAFEGAVAKGDRYVPVAVTLVVVTVIGGVLGVIFLGRLPGPGVEAYQLSLSFGLVFGAAFLSMWRSTKRGMRARAELDAKIAELARRIAR